MTSLEEHSILITGGGSGLGEGTARYFVARGARVTITGRRADALARVQGDLGDACAMVVGDVTVDADRRHMVEVAVAHGNGHLHTLLNNAGNMYRGPLAELDEQQLLDVFHSNVIAGIMLAQVAQPHLQAERGAIIFIGSVHSQRAFPGASPYAATKGAVETLTGVLAAELGPLGVRVSCVRPGGVFSQINQRAGLSNDEQALARLHGLASAHALGRIGTTEEIAEAIAYLATAQWTTGAVMTVDGGLSLGVTNA